MPVITFASPKGGVGKTTAALILATELAQKGVGVTVIDADPENHIFHWSEKGGKPKNLHVMTGSTEKTIVNDIEKAQEETPFVVIDMEGTGNLLVAWAMAQSDLIVVPIKPSSLDARGAAKALSLIKQQERVLRRKLSHAILLNSTKAAIRTRALIMIEKELAKANIPILQTQLLEREAFRQIFAQGKVLEKLEDQYKLEDAIQNARAFAGEIITWVKNSASSETTQHEVKQHA